MKNRRAYGLLLLAPVVVLALVPWGLFPVCGVGRYASPDMGPVSAHGCYKTLVAESVVAVIAALAAVAAVIVPRRGVIKAASLLVIVAAGLAVLFPTVITGVCRMATMPCVYGTRPALVVAGIIMACAGVFSFVKGGREI